MKLKITKNIFFIIALALSSRLYSNPTESWSALQVTHDFKEKYTLYSELQYRLSLDNSEYRVSSTRLGFGVSTLFDIKALYIVENSTQKKSSDDELRGIFQLSRAFKNDSIDLSTRFRFENRKFANSERWMNRVRLAFRGDMKFLAYGVFHPFASYESLVILNTVAGRRAGTHDMRPQIGIATTLETLRIDLSYMRRMQDIPLASDKDIDVLNLVFALKI